jgi:hypothetical protein
LAGAFHNLGFNYQIIVQTQLIYFLPGMAIVLRARQEKSPLTLKKGEALCFGR